MRYTHCFEVVGTVLFRPSGSAGFPPVECKVIEAKIRTYTAGTVWFSELTTGNDGPYIFSRWFSDWQETDDMAPGSESAYHLQEGRSVQVAVPVVAYDEILRTGRPYPRCTIIGGDEETQARLSESAQRSFSDMVQAPIAAVRIDSCWVAPEPPRGLMHQRSMML